MKLALFYLLVVGIVCLDQIVKGIIVEEVDLLEVIPVIPGAFDITHIQNDGAAYNLFSQFPLMLIVMPAIVMLAGLVYMAYAFNKKPTVLITAISLVIGGGLGNLIDRINKGYVVDFFDIHIIPIFNVADMFITAGCALLFIYLIFIDGKQIGKTRTQHE
jgi:signal peptidase II